MHPRRTSVDRAVSIDSSVSSSISLNDWVRIDYADTCYCPLRGSDHVHHVSIMLENALSRNISCVLFPYIDDSSTTWLLSSVLQAPRFIYQTINLNLSSASTCGFARFIFSTIFLVDRVGCFQVGCLQVERLRFEYLQFGYHAFIGGFAFTLLGSDRATQMSVLHIETYLRGRLMFTALPSTTST